MPIQPLLEQAMRAGASDLHLSVGLPPLLRLDGDIQPCDCAPLAHEEVRALLFEIMSAAQRETYARELELDFACTLPLPTLARFRVNAFMQRRGAAAVLRLIPSAIPTPAQLGLGAVFERLCALPRGLVCVTGPTGSGKSTTLAALLDHLNATRRQHILTIEDPVEFVHTSKLSLVTQREVGRDTPSFASALRAALREDPDVILVGELRDLDTIRLALTAAETGHLVLCTLHTSSAAKTVDRIVDVFPGAEKALVRTLLAESLQAVVAQVLLKREGGGRIAAHEILWCTPAIRNRIREDKVAQMYSVLQTGAQLGMQTLDQALKRLVEQGVVNRDDARAKARAPETL
ncbi:MAG: type IV pilus twitching motility protein PilT [Pseudomonadales bacterium]|nr:type IV pilus twitching motility protein PilT [Pseudomonadales bacterium]